ncbi:MAG: CTP synthase [Candidatus Cloacimonetes bacterium]|nr:CTP synthase [Candidatus Cloacimonadota bacterium]MBS3767023.1 CTP synthase [Candidatus Cloacimonadota bacterium]
MKTKYIFITGGVVSSLGKGIASSSIGFLLKDIGYEVSIQKYDPYLNVDPGTMNPFQHGEVFVTEDGAETDLDLGHYERFLDKSLSQKSNTTAGIVYEAVINNERNGKYLGKTVQTIPHITNEIKRRFKQLDEESDIVIIEIGGTVGDIEGLPFLESIRQFMLEHADTDTLAIHLTLVPYINAAGESKTKPTQHSVIKLREIGIQPDMLICRSTRELNKSIISKISLFTNVPESNVIVGKDSASIYEIPMNFEKQNMSSKICKHFKIKHKKVDFTDWAAFVRKSKYIQNSVKIAICGKYVKHQDAYKSIVESLNHAGIINSHQVDIEFISTEAIMQKEDSDKIIEEKLDDLDAVLIPGGFGYRGIEGKISIIQHAREIDIPFLGICLGMQCAVIEFARNVLGLDDANSKEFDENTPHPVIDLMEEQKNVTQKGGTMRLGAYPGRIIKKSKTHEIYKKVFISERHRHRYEFNNKYLEEFEDNGMKVGCKYVQRNLVEIVEIPDHRFFIGTQFHPEFKSRPLSPHPIFKEFVKTAIEFKNEN